VAALTPTLPEAASRRTGRGLVRWFGAVAVAVVAWRATADEPTLLERQVKAAFLYKFAGYVGWPRAALPRPGAPFVIGVVGDAAARSVLEDIVAGRSIAGHPIAVREYEAGAAERPQILFVTREAMDRGERVIDALRTAPCLVVTETRNGLLLGSVVNFVLADGHVRFEISKPAAQRRGLALSSRLLGVAQNVITKAAP